ncbi:lipase family protein [Peredibacter starrii]|uniref:Thioesterase domain-containing protein n=1 Tax=Peredibacter starrii TaxID=28202 RepID=A0AAX4HJ45_9BACT|nr:thioesterase domain-containing protein [Peredibacter starrii]WPU63240.1 thioesterase domain-containing protein [Peredibacter starrii]
MKTDLTTPGSYAQTKALAPKNNSALKPVLNPLDLKPTGSGPDYKVELSSPKLPSAPSLPGVPSLPDFPSLNKPKPEVPTKEIVKEEIKEEIKAEAVKKPEAKEGSVKKPAIFFIKGLDIFSSPSNSESGYAGLGRMAEAVDGSRLYGWDQKEEIIKEIKKVHPDYPVILVGHSLGGDTAIEVADELDSLGNKFKGVDLLVTIDAVGFSHDIVPQNVKKHLNVFGEKSLFLNDGPHVARREEKTSVRNILSPLDHTEIDDDREIQFEIMSMIQETLKGVIY